MEWVTITIGVIEGITAILLAVIAASKKVRKAIGAPLNKWMKETVQEATQERFDNIDKRFEGLETKLENTEKHELTILRHEITLIYEKYRKEKKLPTRIKQSLCSLYEQYKELGGNSYITTIMEEMLEVWEEI